MKITCKLFLSTTLWILSTVLVTGQSISWSTPVEHDFGTFKQWNAQRFEFVFTNTSEDTLLIDNVRTTCGCTAPDWTYEPIPPGTQSIIGIEYDGKKVGYFRKKIKVYFSGIRKSEVLWVEGEVVE